MLDHVSSAEGHDVLGLRGGDIRALVVKLAHKTPPCLEAVVTLDQTDDLGGIAEVLGERTEVPVDRLGLGELQHQEAGHVERAVLLASTLEGIADLVTIHRDPSNEAL